MAWTRLPGKARNYINSDTGAILSRRQYDALQELAGRRTHYDVPRLAKQRRAQEKYNDLVSSYAKGQIETIELQMEEIQRQLDEGEIDELEAMEDMREFLGVRATVKKRTRESGEFKEAIKALKSKDKGKEANDEKVKALKFLGRRQGIPDWVPEGLSDRFRRGKLRKDRIPKSAYGKIHKHQTMRSKLGK